MFERNQGGADNWGQVKKLIASDGATDDLFGYTVSISGDTLVVGAYQDDDNGSDSGSAYVFARNQGGADNWGQVAKLIASDGAEDDRFGRTVSISGDTLAVGAHGDDDNGSESGSAYVFERNQGGADSWGQVKKLTSSDVATGDNFGLSVSISGDTLIVGAVWDDDNGSNSGSAYLFERNQGGADNWGEIAKLTASDGAADDEFGHAVSISGDTLVVGMRLDDDNGPNSGSAYVFRMICLLEFGDAPDSPYPTLLTNNGARHLVDYAVFLGSNIDTEFDGQPDPNALGDDTDANDDEDGVAFDTQLVLCEQADIQITTSQAGKLDA
ncbi:FG-GAP repeat protein [Chloroflexota bacterium]